MKKLFLGLLFFCMFFSLARAGGLKDVLGTKKVMIKVNSITPIGRSLDKYNLFYTGSDDFISDFVLNGEVVEHNVLIRKMEVDIPKRVDKSYIFDPELPYFSNSMNLNDDIVFTITAGEISNFYRLAEIVLDLYQINRIIKSKKPVVYKTSVSYPDWDFLFLHGEVAVETEFEVSIID